MASSNQTNATALASPVGVLAEPQRSLKTRAAPATPEQACEILARAGQGNPPRSRDESDGEEPPE